MVVMLSLLAAVPMTSDGADSDSYWTYTLNYDSSKMTSETESALSYADSTLEAISNSSTTLSSVTTTGSWGWEGEYGPFGSYYAVFDANGDMLGHLNPNNLTQWADGTDASSTIKTCNVMWCLPTIYWSSTDTSVTLTNDPDAGGIAYAHTIDGTTYAYLGIGVYEGVVSDGKLMSTSGSTPTASTTRTAFRTYAAANSVTDGDAMLWNFYQYTLYKLCAYTVMADFDSQSTVGQGPVNTSKKNTGLTDGMGPYAGNVSAQTDSVKLFVENAWGSVWEFVDDVVVKDRVVYAGQRGTVDDTVANMENLGITLPSTNGYVSDIQTDARVWGMAKAVGGTATTGLTDYYYQNSGERLVISGGDWSYTSSAGVGCADCYYSLSSSDSHIGARLAYVFAADSAAPQEYTVTYDANGGTGTLTPQTVEGKGTCKVPAFEISRDGYNFLGWSASKTATEATYTEGSEISVSSDMTLYAVWEQIPLKITSTPTGSMLNGSSWNYTVEANCEDYTVTVSGLDWLQSAQHTVFGAAPGIGTYTATVTVSKDGFDPVTQEISILVISVLEYTSPPTSGLITYEG